MDTRRLKNVDNIIKQLKERGIEAKESKIVISNRLLCDMCSFILNNPYQTDCGCLFCKECIENWIINHKFCPGKSNDCGSTILKSNKGIRPDKARAKEVLSVRTKCLFEGCNSVCEISRMSNHLDECQFQTVRCDLCKEDVVLRDLESHKATQCQERNVACDFCHKTMKLRILQNEHNNTTHDKLCIDFLGKCPYKCGDNVMIRVAEHRELCVNKPMQCPLNVCGCTCNNITKSQMEQHFTNDNLLHCISLVEYFNEKNRRVANLNLQIAELNDTITELSNIVSVIESGKMVFSQTISNYKPDLEVGNCDDDVVCRNGQFIWKVDRFTALLNEAKAGTNIAILSKPFYSSDFGYKLCLKIYPFGDGIGHGTHLSIFFVLNRGTYDNILSWPFTNKIKLSLLPGSKSVATEHAETFKPDPRSACYAKPVTAFNPGSGSPKFVSHQNLYGNYMIDNTFYIMATVVS